MVEERRYEVKSGDSCLEIARDCGKQLQLRGAAFVRSTNGLSVFLTALHATDWVEAIALKASYTPDCPILLAISILMHHDMENESCRKDREAVKSAEYTLRKCLLPEISTGLAFFSTEQVTSDALEPRIKKSWLRDIQTELDPKYIPEGMDDIGVPEPLAFIFMTLQRG